MLGTKSEGDKEYSIWFFFAKLCNVIRRELSPGIALRHEVVSTGEQGDSHCHVSADRPDNLGHTEVADFETDAGQTCDQTA